jgi:phospho-N-acetylmuramoyl-pentapeptide-transferase
MIVYFITALVFSFVLTAAAERILIPKLKSMKLGQQILDIGPRWHKSKEGTPTMGGLGFIISSLLVFFAFALYFTVKGEADWLIKPIIIMLMATANGAIGVFDDLTKFKNHRNEGLTATQKYLLQLICAGIFLAALKLTGNLTTELYIPFFGDTVELGILYYVFSLLLITGIINSVNLTDGIDGLASTVTLAVAAFFAIASFRLGLLPEALISGITIGICLGFLVYNFYPARVFMGDTGSLFLGGLVIGLAYTLNNPLIIVVVGIIYIFEALSVMLQVTYFKLTHGKRIFKMAPIHHHFEKCGWSELKVVGVFSLVTVIAGAIAYFGL